MANLEMAHMVALTAGPVYVKRRDELPADGDVLGTAATTCYLTGLIDFAALMLEASKGDAEAVRAALERIDSKCDGYLGMGGGDA